MDTRQAHGKIVFAGLFETQSEPGANTRTTDLGQYPHDCRVATNDEWLGLMLDAMDRSGCEEGKAGNCGTWAAAPYFVSYIIAVSIIMLNLFTAVIIENFEKQQQSETWVLQPGVLEDLAEVWAEFDDGVLSSSAAHQPDDAVLVQPFAMRPPASKQSAVLGAMGTILCCSDEPRAPICLVPSELSAELN